MHTFEVLIIGSGFGGQCAAVNLLKAGIDDFRLLERRDFFGGTWCQNTYPGAAVDVPSPLYSLSFAPYRWTQMFAEQAELHRYTRHVVEHFGLRDKVELQANVEGVEWEEVHKRWAVHTTKGVFYAQFLINATGPLSQPVVPHFEGQERFHGKTFHTNQWDHSYDYRQKRVAIVGSGASAAQVIPAIAPDVEHLHVFQRTPHWVLPRADRTLWPLPALVARSQTGLQAAALDDLLAIRNPGDCLQILEAGNRHGAAPGPALSQTPGARRRTAA